MAIIFSGVTKHGALQFAPGVPYSFEDVDAEPYFVACGWAEYTDRQVEVYVTLGQVDIDPETVMTKDGAKLLVQDLVAELRSE